MNYFIELFHVLRVRLLNMNSSHTFSLRLNTLLSIMQAAIMPIRALILVILPPLSSLIKATNYCPAYNSTKASHWDVIFIVQASFSQRMSSCIGHEFFNDTTREFSLISFSDTTEAKLILGLQQYGAGLTIANT